MTPVICEATILDATHTLLVHFSDGANIQYDASKLLLNPAFERLRNWGYFKNFHIAPGGYALIWDNDTDISENEIYTNGKRLDPTSTG